jgi:hypothetical protein
MMVSQKFDFAFCADDDGDDGDDDDALWLEDEKGSDEVEDESIFALDPDSVAVVQVEGEASFFENICYYQRYCLLLLSPRPK